MTIDHVARRADLGKGTIYLYFESKQDLALSIVDRVNERLRSRLRTILCSGGSPEDRLHKMLIERVMFRLCCVENYREAVDQMFSMLREQLLARRKSYIDQEAVIFVEILVEGRTLAVFHCPDPLATAHALLTATSALLPYSLSPAELGSREQVQQRADAVIELLMKGLTTKGDQNGV
jgi:AcrR family transcriptional regulator